ncbi:MAG: B12-binding domain-containing radical SAM protein [Desulfobacterales bacterium]|nr:B12-binding domain-containing radical SAM protein [Desulfobacterales bacterium]
MKLSKANPTNILLVYPEIPQNTFWSYSYSLPFINKKSSVAPLGLITIASLFPSRYKLKLIDMNVEPLRNKDLKWADAVFISAMIVQKESFISVVERCKQFSPIIVAGGPYPTSSWEEIKGVDYFVLGEAEDIFTNFLTDMENGVVQKKYASENRPNLSQTLIPRFDLLKMNAYGSMAVQYSRGCPFKCEFCDIWKVYGNKPRLKSAGNLISELDTLYLLGWRGAVFFVDDNFIGNKNRVKEELMLPLIEWQKKHDYPFRFFTEASINLAEDDALLKSMQLCGFNEVFIGIETPSVESLQETGKIQNLKGNIPAAVSKIQSYGMEVKGGFILGFDNDPDDIFSRMCTFIDELAIPTAMVGILTALPGTQLYKRLEREGRIINSTSGNNTHCLETNFITRMDKTKLIKGYQQVLATIYDKHLKTYFERCNKLLDNIGEQPLFNRKVHWAEMKMGIKSLVRQPLTSYGYQYLKFLLRNFLKNNKNIAEAIRMGIIGHHFHTITRQTLSLGANN